MDGDESQNAVSTPHQKETVREVLAHGTLEVIGRLTEASNISLVATASLDGVGITCVYKPIRGERPLWDFPDGTLAEREVAAFQLAELAGWNCVPTTLMRPGPHGKGMVQEWISSPHDPLRSAADDADSLAGLFALPELPDGWLPVLRAVDEDGEPLVLAHADDPRLAVLAGFDLVSNNADRKASHILLAPDGRVLGVDHGLTFHGDPKLRTILWGWTGRPLPDAVAEGLARLRRELPADGAHPLADLVNTTEWDALIRRLDSLTTLGTFPAPPEDRTPIPWPPL